MNDDYWRNYRALADRILFGSSGAEPMTAYGRYTARLDRADRDFKANNEAVSDELLAALRRIQITSARTS